MTWNTTKKRNFPFFTEQLSLILIKDPRRRRYSCDLLTMTCMWQNDSPALYKQIKSESILTLPTAKYVRKLSSGLNVEGGYEVSDVTRAYLQAKKKKLSEKYAIVAILMDEIYVQKSVQYANGKFYGMENNAIVKTLLCVMIKSVAGNYKDVVSITCMVNINADILHKVWLNVVKVVTELKFGITVTMTDGHSSNVKFFKEKLCDGFIKMWVPNPLSPGNRIFLLFDPTHLFKNIYNNFRTKENFICPSMTNDQESDVTLASFASYLTSRKRNDQRWHMSNLKKPTFV